MKDKIRWGILSTGKIAHVFTRGLQMLPDAEVVAVGSRSRERAEEFGKTYNIPNRHGSYDDLAADPGVDIIYVATPHAFHKEHTLMAIAAGKAVLCEKPFAINADQAREMIDFARERRKFLMEAFWPRFIPSYAQIRQWLAEKRIGNPVKVIADFSIVLPRREDGGAFKHELGGGALLDIGCYAMQLISLALGPTPSRIASLASIGQTGVDEHNGCVLMYENGAIAVFSCSITVRSDSEAWIIGDRGRIHLHGQFNEAMKLTLVNEDGETSVDCTIDRPVLRFQAPDVMQRLRAGELESPLMPLDETYEMMKTLDAIRAQWGLKYPQER